MALRIPPHGLASRNAVKYAGKFPGEDGKHHGKTVAKATPIAGEDARLS
jgi:hypothetical protein